MAAQSKRKHAAGGGGVSKKWKKKYFPLMELIVKSNKPQRDSLLKLLPENAVDVLCECIYNGIGKQNKKALKIMKKENPDMFDKTGRAKLRYLCNTQSTKMRRRKAIQSGGAIATILATVLPILASLIISKLAKS